MSAYVIVQISVKDTEAYEEYKSLAPPSISAFGGRYRVRGGATESLEGSWNPSRMLLVDGVSSPTKEQSA